MSSNDDEIQDLFWTAIETFPEEKRAAAADWLMKRIAALEAIEELENEELRDGILPDEGE
ncbi:hypothetical protein XH99_31880 [Bradyrhizobium nanningense]|uniref:Uncharacterized protein n=1 Tax=Bradyrhizobium nanningense TaxID=1325118 RepID=A0A4Q0RW09_9BRAD|nr:hypothetical protein [Bradyrhizobium nanningense]RXH23314.1 hypothetical protein XH99_31880 [Bradyrhizobium nanningense]RXH27585.1 hypothetical protein XH84_29755 [Bradyrhizobium nanningense]